MPNFEHDIRKVILNAAFCIGKRRIYISCIDCVKPSEVDMPHVSEFLGNIVDFVQYCSDKIGVRSVVSGKVYRCHSF